MQEESFFNQILEQAKKQRRKIGISIVFDLTPEIVKSLEKSKEIADVVIYGKEIPGFECVVMSGDKEIGERMVLDYQTRKIDQFVRGQIDDFGMVEQFKKSFNIDPSERRVDTALVAAPNGYEFFLIGGSNPDCQNLEEKKRHTDGVLWYLQEYFPGVKPKVAVMATCRPGSYGKDPVMSGTFDEAEAMVKYLNKKNIEAKNVHIEIEKAMEWGANVVLAARGAIGNQIFRVLYYLCKGKIYCCPTIFPSKGIYEDNSRNETDWYPHFVVAAAYANK